MSADIRTRPATKEYRDGWERTFGAKSWKPGRYVPERCEACGHVKHLRQCTGTVAVEVFDDDSYSYERCPCGANHG